MRFVTVNVGGWDTHANNFEGMKKASCRDFDQAFAALIEDLDQRGQLDKTLVLSWGEFGRTPRINKDAGRDHWPNVFSVAMAGGGLKRGFVLGESDARAEFPKERPVSPQDVLATMYHQLGIDQTKNLHQRSRPSGGDPEVRRTDPRNHRLTPLRKAVFFKPRVNKISTGGQKKEPTIHVSFLFRG